MIDLLRTKIFLKRFGYHILVESRPCSHVQDQGFCPGKIKVCPFCSREVECRETGGSLFALELPVSMVCQ